MEHGTIIQIDNCLVSEDIVKEFFACDYGRCHGCCCIIGDSGAPLLEEETGFLERDYASFSHLMTEPGRKSAESCGYFSIDRDGDLVTPTVSVPHKVPNVDYVPGSDGTIGVPGIEECAFCHFEEDGSCFCSIERSYFAGRCTFRKPISCRLYPIRITKLSNGMDALNLHRWKICSDAFEKGRREGIRVYQFLQEPLTDLYGADFYEALCAAAAHINGE